MIRFILVFLFFSGSVFAQEHACSQLNSDEVAVFYSTAARKMVNNQGLKYWEVPIHLHVFEPEHDSFFNHLFIWTIAHGFDVPIEELTGSNFERRLQNFLVDNQSRKKLLIRVGKNYFPLKKTGPNGHSTTILHIPEELIDPQDSRIQFTLASSEKDSCQFSGHADKIYRKGVTVISDIDDTIKDSNVQDKMELLRNSLIRDFKDVPGMSETYANWKAIKADMCFHYISGSPWQLHEPLSEFIKAKNFPEGPIDLKYFRIWDQSITNLFTSQVEYKLNNIRNVINRFPDRKYILVGDSSEQDPEIYGQIARDFPDKILHVFIREVPPAPGGPRFDEAFKNVPAEKWKIFTDPKELKLDL